MNVTTSVQATSPCGPAGSIRPCHTDVPHVPPTAISHRFASPPQPTREEGRVLPHPRGDNFGCQVWRSWTTPTSTASPTTTSVTPSIMPIRAHAVDGYLLLVVSAATDNCWRSATTRPRIVSSVV